MTDLDEQHEQLTGRGGGASIVIKGNRFADRLERAFWAFLGLAIVAGAFTAANNLYNLNVTVAQGVKNDEMFASKFQDHESRLRQVERDVSAIEGKVFRGGFDPLKDPCMDDDDTYDPYGINQRNARYGAQVLNYESNRLVPVLVALAAISLCAAGLALGVAAWALREADRAQHRADLAQLEVESFKNVLHAARLPTSAHLPGESP